MPVDAARQTLMADVVGKQTPTFSGRRTEAGVYLDRRVDARLEDWGILDLNRRLGYA
jgi:hypothetical protein